MSKELEEWLKLNDKCESYEATQLAESAWNAARDTIIKILQDNKMKICSHGHDAGMEIIYWDDIKEIENL